MERSASLWMCAKTRTLRRLHEMLCSWREQAAKLEAGEISKEDYDKWPVPLPPTWTPPLSDRRSGRPQGLSDLLTDALKK